MYISRQINAQNQIFNDDEFRDDERSLEIIAREGNEHGRKKRYKPSIHLSPLSETNFLRTLENPRRATLQRYFRSRGSYIKMEDLEG